MNQSSHTVTEVKPALIIALCGATGTGKSSFISDASGQDFPIGHMQESCTVDVRPTAPFKVDGRLVVLIDTPGFDDTTLSDADVLEKIATFLKFTYAADQKLSGVIYMHRITDNRVGGVSRRNFHTFYELCGETSLVNVVILTNMWHDPAQPIELTRENELMTSETFFQPALCKGARSARYALGGGPNRAHDIIRMFMSNTPMALQVQREMVDERKQLQDTCAGQEVLGQLHILIERYRKDLESATAELKRAVERKDEETRQELEEHRRATENNSIRARDQVEQLSGGYSAERHSREEKMKRLLEEHEALRRQEEEETTQLQSHLNEVLQLLATATGPDRRRFMKEVETLRDRIASKQENIWKRMVRFFTGLTVAPLNGSFK